MMKDKLNIFLLVLTVAILILSGLWIFSLSLARSDYDKLMKMRESLSPSLGLGEGGLCLDNREIRELKPYFFNSSTTLKFIEDLEEISRQTNVSLELGRVEEAKEELLLSLSTKGQYGSSLNFLEKLELMPYAIRVERFDLRLDAGLWSGSYLVSLLREK